MKTSSIVTCHPNMGSYSSKLLQGIKVLCYCYMKTDWSALIHLKQKDMTIKLTYQYFPLCRFDFIYLPYNYVCKFTFFLQILCTKRTHHHQPIMWRWRANWPIGESQLFLQILLSGGYNKINVLAENST